MTAPESADDGGRYANPIATDGDFADPFVLRFNGRYYLYCTNADLRCWSSTDLVEWTAHGPTISPDLLPGLVPFAPEVVYSNGYFYLYTSPSGTGHIVLRSEHPTGPFEAVSGNVAHEIDGNVLIDDDGRWYFYWAGDEGIWACEMPSPTTFGEPVLTGANMHGWTEGPFVTKSEGRYHMTLTGNHYLAPGYRINAAVSNHPLRGYVDDPLNPLLLNVEGPGIALGHSSSVIGPDLVSNFMAYHNLNPDESRDLNIARQVANGDTILVLGPAASAQAPPKPHARCDWSSPDALAQWDVRAGALAPAGDWAELLADTEAIWRSAVSPDLFTAEVTLVGTTLGRYGITFESDLTERLIIDPERNTITIGGEQQRLPADFAHGSPHTYRLVRNRTSLTVFVDGRRQLSGLISGGLVRIGVASEADGARVGFVAVTASDAATADRLAAKPVPGRFWAVHGAGDFPVVDRQRDGVCFRVLDLGLSAQAQFTLDVPQAGRYRINLTGEFIAGDCIEVGVGDIDDDWRPLAAETATRVLSADVNFPSGTVAYRMRGAAGRPLIALVTVVPATVVPSAFTLPGPVDLDGFGKRTLADGAWQDFELETTLRVSAEADGAHGDILLRATQMSEGGSTADDTELGIDFLLGYSVQLSAAGVALVRHDYDSKVLASYPCNLDLTKPVHLAIRVSGGAIVVAVDGVDRLQHDEPLPHLSGGLGMRVAGATLTIQHLAARPCAM